MTSLQTKSLLISYLKSSNWKMMKKPSKELAFKEEALFRQVNLEVKKVLRAQGLLDRV